MWGMHVGSLDPSTLEATELLLAIASSNSYLCFSHALQIYQQYTHAN